MFRFFRLALALGVVVQHLLGIPYLGHFAVHGFFILSGYLMTYIMLNTYSYSLSGVSSFIVNRLLRLYPLYWCVLIISVFIVVYFGEESSKLYREFIYLPNDLESIVQNIFFVYLDFFSGHVAPGLSPSTWALTVELFFYVLIALGISKTAKSSIIFLFISLSYMVSTHLLGYEYANRYNALFAGGLPFSIGACLFHYHARLISTLKKLLVPRSLFIITVVFILNFIFINVFKKMDMNFMFYLSFYLNYIITAAFILHFSVAKASPSVRKLDKIFGDFSYPTYLLHWQIAFLVSMLVFNVPITGLNIDGVSVFILTIPVTFLVSYGLSVVVDRPVEILRLKVKSKINTRALKGGGENVTV